MSESIWKNRDFILLITGRTVSQFGTAMTTFVIPWLFLQLTGSATQTGIAFAVGFIPYIIISLPAGVWADRYNRKTLMIATDGGRLLLLSAIPLTHIFTRLPPLCLLYAIQAGVSALSAIFDAAYGACLPSILVPEKLREANNALQTSMSFSKVAGPIFGGIAASLIGTADTILVDIASYIISVMSIAAIASSFSSSLTPSTREKNAFIKEVQAGITTVWSIKPIRYLMLFATLINLVGPGMDVALIYRLQHELHLRAEWGGIVMTMLSVGMIVGAFVNRRVAKRIGVGTWLTISAMLQVIPPIVLAFTQSIIVICFVQIFVGILLVAWNVQSVTLRQTLIPNHLLGRGSSVFRLSAWISIPVGDAMAGIISQHTGTRTYFIVAACVLGTVALLSGGVKLHRAIPSSGSSGVIRSM